MMKENYTRKEIDDIINDFVRTITVEDRNSKEHSLLKLLDQINPNKELEAKSKLFRSRIYEKEITASDIN